MRLILQIKSTLRMFNKCSKNVPIELCRNFCTTFYCPYIWTVHKKATFPKIRVAYNKVYRTCWVFVAVQGNQFLLLKLCQIQIIPL